MVDCPDLHVRDNQAINCNNLDFNAEKYLSRMLVRWCFPHKFQVSNMFIFLGGFYGTSQLKDPQVEMTEVIREIEQAELMLGAVTMCISIPLKSPSSPWFLGCVSYCNIGGVAFNPLQETVDPRKTWIIWAPNGPQEDARCHRLHAEFTIPPVLPSGRFLGRAGRSRTAQGDQNHCENWSGKNRTKLSFFFLWGISCRCSPKLCSICLLGLAVSQNWGSLAIGFPSEWPIWMISQPPFVWYYLVASEPCQHDSLIGLVNVVLNSWPDTILLDCQISSRMNQCGSNGMQVI